MGNTNLSLHFQSIHNRLQSEKNVLQAAVQACEAAAASISRPGTPLSPAGSLTQQKELQVKLKLESLIDQVRTRLRVLTCLILNQNHITNRTVKITTVCFT